MSKPREFEETNERDGPVVRKAARIVCRKCGVSTSQIMQTGHGGNMPRDVIARKFEQKGWTVGQNGQWDFCPAHNPKHKEKPALTVVKTEDKPREMGREDRRIIFEKLNDTYLDEKSGYSGGWSDHRVATELGCPRKWVEQVRDEMFGASGSNPEMTEYLNEVNALLADARDVLIEARKIRDQITGLLKNHAIADLANIETRIGAVDRLADKVRKLVV